MKLRKSFAVWTASVALVTWTGCSRQQTSADKASTNPVDSGMNSSAGDQPENVPVGGPEDQFMLQQIEILEEMREAIEAKQPESVLEPLQDRLAEITQRWPDLKLTPQQTHTLLKRHQAAYDEATERLQEATTKRSGEAMVEALKASGAVQE